MSPLKGLFQLLQLLCSESGPAAALLPLQRQVWFGFDIGAFIQPIPWVGKKGGMMLNERQGCRAHLSAAAMVSTKTNALPTYDTSTSFPPLPLFSPIIFPHTVKSQSIKTRTVCTKGCCPAHSERASCVLTYVTSSDFHFWIEGTVFKCCTFYNENT